MQRERHQKGWIVVSGKTERKWIGHWMPWRADGTRTHERVVLGLKSKLTKWEAEDKLRAHIAEQEKRPITPEGEPTFQWFGPAALFRREPGARKPKPWSQRSLTTTYCR
jgi:hypothetical protein